MGTFNIFSPFLNIENLKEDHVNIKNAYLDKIIDNYNNQPDLSPDWNVHTSYNIEHLLKNKIDWSYSLNIYSHYIDKFIYSYFNKKINWEICGGMWYTAYGPGQTANIHEHVPDIFSVVHFLKFNPNEHWPLTFINPNSPYIKLMLDKYPALRNNINFNNQNQSLFHPRFTPHVEEGDLIIFPSNLDHMVQKTDSKELRVTIAFNIKII
jgi:hypothetical protein